MKRSAPMRRSDFVRERKPLKVYEVHTPRTRERAVARTDMPARMCVPVPKARPVRNESYRRLVAMLPCMACGKHGPNQCAHANSPAAGKGLGLKADDRESFSLCPPCHRLFDQGAMFTKAQRREIEPLWANRARMEVRRLVQGSTRAIKVVEAVIGP